MGIPDNNRYGFFHVFKSDIKGGTKMTKMNIRWILIGALILIVFTMKGTAPAESVAAIEGQQCSVDEDCPCWGTYNVTATDITAYGIGTASCSESMCDMTYCCDVQPAGEWLRDKPWLWMKENVLFTVLLAALFGWVTFFWPADRRG